MIAPPTLRTKRTPTPQEVVEAAARAAGVTTEETMSAVSRSRAVSSARRMLSWGLRYLCDMTWPEVARFGGWAGPSVPREAVRRNLAIDSEVARMVAILNGDPVEDLPEDAPRAPGETVVDEDFLAIVSRQVPAPLAGAKGRVRDYSLAESFGLVRAVRVNHGDRMAARAEFEVDRPVADELDALVAIAAEATRLAAHAADRAGVPVSQTLRPIAAICRDAHLRAAMGVGS